MCFVFILFSIKSKQSKHQKNTKYLFMSIDIYRAYEIFFRRTTSPQMRTKRTKREEIWPRWLRCVLLDGNLPVSITQNDRSLRFVTSKICFH